MPTADLEAQRAFYGDRLGFETSIDGNGLRIEVGGSSLRFRFEPGFRGTYHFALGVPRSKVAASERYLRDRGVEPIPDSKGATRFDFDFWDAEATYFFDPAGNIGEFIGRAELSDDPSDDRPFGPADALGISELGIACDDLPRAVETLQRELAIEGYRDVSPTFHPLGDAHGLFVLVPQGRTWFPDTGIRAESLPSSVVLATERGRYRVQTAPLRVEPV